eukprot:CAMPEP_0178415386 /NCGR_PEP_ID=MMETSP0689_2-20121128/23524_1 /TAXON_ID=160604 /ORGANISM="Amphidinium massartii, Strain CS-259" /LENGTH=133 /DNA_ID=CAMNT_0020036703 /DNA_START=29 /DNA_END=430 /DNA_ORIENTATION=+
MTKVSCVRVPGTQGQSVISSEAGSPFSRSSPRGATPRPWTIALNSSTIVCCTPKCRKHCCNTCVFVTGHAGALAAAAAALSDSVSAANPAPAPAAAGAGATASPVALLKSVLPVVAGATTCQDLPESMDTRKT